MRQRAKYCSHGEDSCFETSGRVLTNIYIVLRYTKKMPKELSTAEYQALAELRYRIRKFLREGDTVASETGLEPQQYLLLLMIRGIPDGQEATVSTLAERLVLKHHSVVELIDRLETHGYVRRSRSREDRRSVLVSLLPRGTRLLEQVAQHRVGELRASGAALANAIAALLKNSHALHGKKIRSIRRGKGLEKRRE
jgi:DNA-binding MarR family transcriptional regulator